MQHKVVQGQSSSEHHETLAQPDGWKGRLHSSSLAATASSLLIVVGPHEGESISLQEERYHVGRADWCDISLHRDLHLSRHHFDLFWMEDGLQVRDRGSRNGVHLDGTRVYHALVQPNQTIKAGDSAFRLQVEERGTQIQVNYHDQSGLLVGRSDKMRDIFSMLKRLGPHELPVLLQGETGTGKTSVARALHVHSRRSGQPFVHVNCGSLSPSLVEAELFGYEKGAFTNADKQHHGFFEQAHGGTLFLDEIAELPLGLQPKLLDVIERKKVRRLGSEEEVSVDFRLLSATHQDLGQAIAQQRFREDLYYRIAVAELTLPPLRNRLEDLPFLVDFMLSDIFPYPIHVSDEAMARLQRYLWPGNVRQLRNILEHATLYVDGDSLEKHHLSLPRVPETLPSSETHLRPQSSSLLGDVEVVDPTTGEFVPLQDILLNTERQVVQSVLEHFSWDMVRVRKELQVSKSWLYKLLKKHELQRPSKD